MFRFNILLLIASMIISMPAAHGQFTGSYDYSTWTTTTVNSGTSAFITTQPISGVILNGPDDGMSSSSISYTHTVVTSGRWSFDWSYSSSDSPTWDTGGWLLNGNYTALAGTSTTSGSGTFAIDVTAGETIGWRVFSVDGQFGAGVLTVQGFVQPVPEPTSMIGVSLFSLGCIRFFRKRRQKQQ